MMSYETVITSAFPSVFALARGAGLSNPDSETSPGGQWLTELRDAFTENAEQIMSADYPEDEARDAAGENAHVSGESTYSYWQAWTDLCLWEWDSEIVSSVKWADISDLPVIILGEVAEALFMSMLTTLQEKAEQEEETEQ